MWNSTDKFARGLALAASASLLPALGLAQDNGVPPLWEIGAVGVAVSQQAYPGSAEHVGRALPLPFLIYRGEFLRVEKSNAGIRAFKSNDLDLDIGVAASLGSKSDTAGVRAGMPVLGTLVEFGPRLNWRIWDKPGQGRLHAEFPLRGVFDLSRSLQRTGTAFEPELRYDLRSASGWSYGANVGAVWGDSRLADTFYGVAPVYATAARPAYAAKSGLITWRLSGSMSHLLTPDLRVFGFARVDTVSGAANAASPLVQKTSGLSLGLVLSYTWMQSERRAAE